MSTDSENLNVMHTSKDATRTFDTSVLGREAVGIQGPGHLYKKVNFYDPIPSLETSSFLDQLEELGADVEAQRRRLRARQQVALKSVDY